MSPSLSTVRLVRRGDKEGLVTELLFASSAIEPEIVEAADDLRALSAEAALVDWEQAPGAARLVHDRSFHRERDLVRLVDELRRGGAW